MECFIGTAASRLCPLAKGGRTASSSGPFISFCSVRAVVATKAAVVGSGSASWAAILVGMKGAGLDFLVLWKRFSMASMLVVDSCWCGVVISWEAASDVSVASVAAVAALGRRLNTGRRGKKDLLDVDAGAVVVGGADVVVVVVVAAGRSEVLCSPRRRFKAKLGRVFSRCSATSAITSSSDLSLFSSAELALFFSFSSLDFFNK